MRGPAKPPFLMRTSVNMGGWSNPLAATGGACCCGLLTDLKEFGSMLQAALAVPITPRLASERPASHHIGFMRIIGAYPRHWLVFEVEIVDSELNS